MIPSSDYSLENPYSTKLSVTCLSKIENWIYKCHTKFRKSFQVLHENANVRNVFDSKTISTIQWSEFLEMVSFYEKSHIELNQNSKVELLDLLNVVVTIKDELTLKVLENTIYFPGKTRFVISDMENFTDLIHEKYSLILLDPPWPNKSVERGQKYSRLDIYSLYSLHLEKITRDKSLVAIWASNNPKIHHFITEKFFKSLGISLIEEWYWIKVTRSGELVLSLSSSHRKPFEVLFIGQVNLNLDKKIDTKKSVKRRAIMSVPSKYHSRKPFVHGQ